MEEGGGTIFPKKGILASPTKGSVLFWYNLKQSGKRAYEAVHAGCPTLYGIKWGRSWTLGCPKNDLSSQTAFLR